MKQGFTFFLLLAILVAVGCGKPAEGKKESSSGADSVVTDMKISKPAESK